MDYYHKYTKYKTKYLKLLRLDQSGGQPLSNLLGNLSGDFPNEFQLDLSELKDKQTFDKMPKTERNSITKLAGVTELEELDGCTNLKEVEFDEFFSYNGDAVINPGDIPNSVEKITFWFDTATVIKDGALPKNLKQIECGSRTFIEEGVPEGVKLIDCKENVLHRKNVVYYQNSIDGYNDDFKNGKLPKNITDLSIWGTIGIGDKKLECIPPTVKNLIFPWGLDQPLNIKTPNLKYLTIGSSNYKYKESIPKSIKVTYGL